MQTKRQRILDGYINCIPSPFKRFSNDFIGIEQSTFYTITSFTKGGKSQFTSNVFIYHPILYAYKHPEKNVSVKILYFPLEETPERITQRFMSYLYYKKTGKRFSPRDLRSTQRALPQEVIDFFKIEENAKILNYFESCIEFYEDANPTGVYKACRQYAVEHGKLTTKTVKTKDEFGVEKEIEVYSGYEPDNPDEYRLVIIDTVNLIDTEKGMTLKQSMDKTSEYLAKYLRNKFFFSPVIIQQQSFESENNDALKIGRIRPSVVGLGDTKYTGRDSNLVLGLFSPMRFGLTEYFGYDIKKLRDNIRFLEVIVNRDGSLGGMTALFFDGAVCEFVELPPPSDVEGMNRVYKYLEKLNESDN